MERARQNQGPSLKNDNVDVIDIIDFRGFAPVPPGRQRAAFTLMELLSVIVTLAILFALVLPAVKLSSRTAFKRQAAADATALAQAALLYRQTYGKWPGIDESQLPADGDDEQAITWLFAAPGGAPGWAETDFPYAHEPRVIRLDQRDMIRSLVPGAEAIENPRNIRFLDVPDSRLDSAGRLVDPWGTPYVAVIHPLTNPDGSPSIGGRVVGWSDVVVFSFGPPGRIRDDVPPGISPTAANLIFSAGVPR